MEEKQVPLHRVVGRIVAVSGIGFASAIGFFLVIGGIWHWGLLSLAATLFFIFLMFFIERGAEGNTPK